MRLEELTPGAELAGIAGDTPVTVVAATWIGSNSLRLTYRIDADGSQNTRLDERILYRDHEPPPQLAKRSAAFALTADGAMFKLAAEALRIRMAGRFDPMLAVHASDLEPLPHQVQAVYGELLDRTPLRFLLADDPGAGKTIMAGLYIKELMLRGDLERCLIVARRPSGAVAGRAARQARMAIPANRSFTRPATVSRTRFRCSSGTCRIPIIESDKTGQAHPQRSDRIFATSCLLIELGAPPAALWGVSMVAMAYESVPPKPPGTIEPLSALGYTLESAIADLDGNTIAVGVGAIDIGFHWNGHAPYTSTADDGKSMSETEWQTAMAVAAWAPRTSRRAAELGRFGMGLKTASFSQASRLSVRTRSAKNKQPNVLVWAPERIVHSSEWQLLRQVDKAWAKIL